MVGTCCISFDHRDQGLRVGERLADLRPRLRRTVVYEVRELGRSTDRPFIAAERRGEDVRVGVLDAVRPADGGVELACVKSTGESYLGDGVESTSAMFQHGNSPRS